jgi:hypothetical protein
MEAPLVDDLPIEARWQFQPKQDGFRCLTFRRRAADCMATAGRITMGTAYTYSTLWVVSSEWR